MISDFHIDFCFKYMTDTWIGYKDGLGKDISALFPPSLWGVHERTLEGVWRTSNNAEAWHGSFGKQVDCAHPGIYKFLDELTKERKFIASRVEQLRTGGSLPPKDKTYRKYAAKLTEICQSYSTSPRRIEDYLRYVARHISIMVDQKRKQQDAE